MDYDPERHAVLNEILSSAVGSEEMLLNQLLRERDCYEEEKLKEREVSESRKR